MIKSNTPLNIDEISIDDVLPLVEHPANEYVPSPRVRLNYIEMLYDVLGLHLSSDAALASVDEPQAELVISPAGGGKTTWSQVKAIEQKLVRKTKRNTGKKIIGDRILCLVYNRHNVEDMKTKHANMVGKINALNIKGIELDNRINACTLHSFCDYLRKLFVAKLGLVGSTTLDDTEASNLMMRAIKVQCKADKNYSADNINVSKMTALYTLSKETLKSVDELTYTDPFIDLELPVEFISSVFERYESIKKRTRKYDFVDMLYLIYDLLSKDANALKQVQEYFDYVIADEVQDFTPLMWEILRLFVSDGTPLTCIGDEDQNIYNFRGANIDYILNFKNNFQDSRIYNLIENRRCREVILNEAREVISQNKLRFDKKIIGSKSGGVIKTYPYSSKAGQVVNLTREIKKLSIDDLNTAVICYRNQESSMLVSEMLAEEGVSVNCLRAYKPYSHELYNHVIGLFTALEMPCDRKAYMCLWKVLPCKKSEFLEAIGYDNERRTFTTSDDKVHFAKINYGKLMGYKGFGDAMALLHRLSESIETENLDKIFPVLYKQLCTYFWNYKRSTNDNNELDDIFEKRVIAKFNVPEKYSKVSRDIQQVKSICANDTRIGNGITLATFHSLKGLEFERVYAIDLDNDIFPNFPLIEYRNYGQKIEQQLKEAETRLWYVAVTRAISELHMFYLESNPSIYVNDYFERSNMALKDTTKVFDVDLSKTESIEEGVITNNDVIAMEEPTSVSKPLEEFTADDFINLEDNDFSTDDFVTDDADDDCLVDYFVTDDSEDDFINDECETRDIVSEKPVLSNLEMFDVKEIPGDETENTIELKSCNDSFLAGLLDQL